MCMEDLPTELWTLICNARTPYTSVNGEHPIIHDATLSNLRLASRTLHHKTQDAFLQRHLSCPKFSLAPMSLELLKELSENETLRPYVKELEFGPDMLNTRLDQDLKFCKDKSYNSYPAELSVKDSPWPIWPIVKLRGSFNLSAARKAQMIVRWEYFYASWAAKYEDRFKDLRDEQWEYREDQVDIDMLLAAIPKFPNLRNIKIDTRPVGPIFSQLFDAQIRPSKGTMALGRAIGAAEMNLSVEDNPRGVRVKSISGFNMDALLFCKRNAETELVQAMFKTLSYMIEKRIWTGPELTVDLVITAVPDLLRSDWFDDTNAWRIRGPRVCNLTFDLAGQEPLRANEANEFMNRATELLVRTSNVEAFNARSELTFLPIGSISVMLEVGAASWNNLKILHMTDGACRADDLLLFLHRHQSTLEEVSFTETWVSEWNGQSWLSVFAALKAFPKLKRLTFDHLVSSDHGTVSSGGPSLPKYMAWMKAEGAENVARMLDVATSGARLCDFPDGTPEVCVVLFEITDPEFEAQKDFLKSLLAELAVLRSRDAMRYGGLQPTVTKRD